MGSVGEVAGGVTGEDDEAGVAEVLSGGSSSVSPTLIVQ